MGTKRAPRVGSETRTGSGPRDDAPARDGVCSMHDQYSTLAWRLPGKSRLVRRQTSLKPYLQYEPAKCAGATLLTASLANGAGARLFFCTACFCLGVSSGGGHRSGTCTVYHRKWAFTSWLGLG